jgi:thiamine transport system substrate-binding protein
MKPTVLSLSLSLSILFFGSAISSVIFVESTAMAATEPTLVVYSYDSLVSKKSWGAQVASSFEKKMRDLKTPVRIQLVSVGEGAQIYNRLRLDQKRGKNLAHIAWGVDTDSFAKISKETTFFEIPKEFPIRKEINLKKLPVGFVPFDFGIYALIQDTQVLPIDQAPRDWMDLILPRFKKKLLLEDPRTSTPGLAWVLGSENAIGKNEVPLFWKNLQSSWLTLSPSWSQAYAMFTKKQAPLIWSYLTSQAYHEESGDRPGRYRAILFDSGQPMQIEGIAILKTAPDFEAVKKISELFVSHVISLESQSKLPKSQWMFPVRSDVVLPESFKRLPEPQSVHPVFDHLKGEARSEVLKRWNDALIH